MKNKNVLYLLFIILSVVFFDLSFVNNAIAKMTIVEVMYDAKGTDTDKEWIKIINDNESEIEISKIKLIINNDNHLIKDLNGLTIINKGDSIVLVDNPIKFKENYPNYQGLLLDSSFSLTNSSGTVAISDDNNLVIDSMSYDPSMGIVKDSGNSLQKIDGDWKAGIPTIVSLENNEAISALIETNDNDISTAVNYNNNSTSIIRTVYVSSHSDPEDLSDYNKEKIFEVSAGRERMALVGSNLEFDAKYRLENVESCTPSFLWSFGDGYSYSGKKVFHIYKNQGEYNVVLNAICGDESAVSRTKVKIYNPEIEIVSIEDRNIEIKNKSSIEINIGGWSIKNYQKDLILPKDTIISPRQSIILSNDYLKLGSILQNVSLIDESKNEISSVFVNLPDSTVLSNNNLEKEEQTIPITNQQSEILSVSNSLDVVISPIQKIVEEDIIDTNLATVYEPEIATHKSSIISRIVSFPINVIKSFFNLFYDF
jgi:hypothetical protein